jgi:hypothetical protein
MNIGRCAGFKKNGLYCAFLEFKKDSNGKIDENSAHCALRGAPRDDYNVYPEHDSITKKVVYNRTNWGVPEPWRVGPNIVWESLTPHDTGFYYSFRRIPEASDEHPCYSIENMNEPSLKSIGNETVITPFGEGLGLGFSPIGWKEQKIQGIERISKCQYHIHGEYNQFHDMILPKCAKEHIGDIPGWINYTTVPPRKKTQYTFILQDANRKEIVEYCVKWFDRTLLAANIAEIMIGIKDGAYVNIREALANNGVSNNTIKLFMLQTNLRINKPIYINTIKYFMYYKYLKSLKKPESFILRANLLNFILNNQSIININPNTPDSLNKARQPIYSTSTRYWWLLMILKDVIKTVLEILEFEKTCVLK